MVLSVIIGNSMEQYFRRAYKIADGDVSVFIRSPICIILLLLTIASILYPVAKSIYKKKMQGEKQEN